MRITVSSQEFFISFLFIESLIKQKWSNNKNAFSGPLHKKPTDGGGSSSKGNSQTRAMDVYGAIPQNGSSMSNGSTQ